MSRPQDDWPKKRTHGQKLTQDEVAIIRQGFIDNKSIPDVARSLLCSSRVVTKYYREFRSVGVQPAKPTPRISASRFYHSNFEPS